MKALFCPGCHAPASPNTSEKFLKCEYCGASFLNEFFSEDEEAACPEELNQLCIKLLKEMGAEAMQDVANTQFGMPIRGGALYDEACSSFEIPEEDEVYFICATGRKGSCDRGFAMTSSGIHFHDEEDECGWYTWEQFVDEDISYSKNVLTVIDSSFRTRAETELVGDFLIALTERAYSEWYGEEVGGEGDDLDKLCVQRLVEKCEEDFELPSFVCGDPLEKTKQLDKAREALAIPAEDDIYLFYDNTIFNSGKSGVAMTDSGVYYNTGFLGSKGSLTWEEFVTGPIVYELDDEEPGNTGGTLTVCNSFSLSFDLENYRDSIVFFIELHNELYKEHTGERAPREWGIRTKEKSLLDILLE